MTRSGKMVGENLKSNIEYNIDIDIYVYILDLAIFTSSTILI